MLRIERKQMARVLHQEHSFSDLFVRYLLSRNNRIQADLVDQLFSSSEKRLARILLLLAHFGKNGRPAADSENQPGNTGRDDWHNPVASQLSYASARLASFIRMADCEFTAPS